MRDEHLAAVAGRHHAGRLVDVEADVAAVHLARLAGVHAHAHADLVAVRPVVAGERALPVRGRRDGVAGRLEGDEELVALGPEHLPAVALERLAQQRAVALQQLGVGLAAAAQQPGRAFDVAEEERDGAGGRGHVASIAPGRQPD